MTLTKDQIIDAAMALDAKTREEVVEILWQSLPIELTPEQRAELNRRKEAADRGETEWLDGEEVMRELRQRFSR